MAENDYDIDKEFDSAYSDEQHEKLMETLMLLISVLKNDTIDKQIISSLNSNAKGLNEFLKKLNEISKPEGNTSLAKSIDTQSTLIINGQTVTNTLIKKLIGLLEKKPVKLEINRDGGYNNNISTIDILYDTVNNV